MKERLLRSFKRKWAKYQLRLDRDKTTFRHRKLGTKYGGWYVPVDFLNSSSICYCVGAGEDVSFDLELINNFGCQVYTFDPTLRARQHIEKIQTNVRSRNATTVQYGPFDSYRCDSHTLANLHFHPYGLWKEAGVVRFYVPKDSSHVSHSIVNLQNTTDYFEAECRDMKGIMTAMSHKDVTLLKLDVEGAEYEILDSILAAGIHPRIICVEFDEGHTPRNDDYPQRIRNAINKMKHAGYRATFFDGWNVTFVAHRTNSELIQPNVYS